MNYWTIITIDKVNFINFHVYQVDTQDEAEKLWQEGISVPSLEERIISIEHSRPNTQFIAYSSISLSALNNARNY